ncbi:VWA containing CoxE family protein, partial [Mycobacterium kansasii]
QALRQLVPHTAATLYWAARVTLVNRMEDLVAFDAVFTAVFGAIDAAVVGPRAPSLPLAAPRAPVAGTVHRAGGGADTLPW